MSKFHFDLRHVADAAGLVVEVHGTTFPLASLPSDTLAAAVADHPVLAAMPAERVSLFSHYADVDDECLGVDGDVVRWGRGVRPAASGGHLPEVVLFAHPLPAHHLRAYARGAVERARRPLPQLR